MPIDLYDEFLAITRALDDAGISYAVVGAMALAIHGVPRATDDIDIMIEPTSIGPASAAVTELGYTAPAAPMTFPSGITVHRVTKFEGSDYLTLDLLLADGPLESIWDTRIELDAESGPVATVSREGLIRMKSLSGRLKDLADIERLGDTDG